MSKKLPPLMASMGGIPFNNDHIEYWKARSYAAEAEIARLKDFITTQKLTELFDRHVAGSKLLAQPPAVGEDVVDIRRPDDENIDEIFAKRVLNLHIEQMSDDGWFMGFDTPDGSYHQFWFGSKNRRAHVEFRHTETTGPEDNLLRTKDAG